MIKDDNALRSRPGGEAFQLDHQPSFIVWIIEIYIRQAGD